MKKLPLFHSPGWFYKAHGGTNILDCLELACKMAKRRAKPVVFVFNDILITVNASSNADELYREYWRLSSSAQHPPQIAMVGP